MAVAWGPAARGPVDAAGQLLDVRVARPLAQLRGGGLPPFW